MKSFLCLWVLVSFSTNAEVSRSPAVIKDQCDLNIETNKIKAGSEKEFISETIHKVILHSDNNDGCMNAHAKKFTDSFYEENASNEIKILFAKNFGVYSKKCTDHFIKQPDNFTCEMPRVLSMTFFGFGCEKVEDENHKVSYSKFYSAKIIYKQRGKQYEEKSAEVVQKEQCARAKKCMEQASEEALPELKKLSAVACNGELTPVSTARAPAVVSDPTNDDGNRIPKSNGPEKSPKEYGSVIK